MRAINTEFYGDDCRWFIGVVKQTGDSRGLGRVRVRIFGIHNEDTTKVKESDLPWASVIVPVTQGGVPGSTQPNGIQVGAQVFGIFLDGKASQSPLILGSIPHDANLRVIGNEPADPYAIPRPSSEEPAVRPGDMITVQDRQILSEAGVSPLPGIAEAISADMAEVLNGSKSKGSPSLRVNLIGVNRQQQAYNYLKNYFESRGNISDPGACAAAFVGNFMNESGHTLDPTARPTTSEPALGIAQWRTTDRRDNLKAFAIRHNTTEDNFSLQLAFVEWELENGLQVSRTYDRLVLASTLLEYTEIVLACYETPNVAIDYHNESNFLTHYWAVHGSLGGIRAAVARSSRQSTAMLSYRDQFNIRLADAKFVKSTYGDS